jgi:hypothetical protein
MPDNMDRFDEDLERLLAADAGASPDSMQDPLLRLSLELRDRLTPGTAPDPEFRARLKAELLEKFSDNVRPFPAPTQLATITPISRWRRARRATAAAALATAASVALIAGYSDLRAHVDTPGSKLALVAGPTITPTATTLHGVLVVPSATPQPSDTASPVKPTSTRVHVELATAVPSDTPIPQLSATATPLGAASTVPPTEALPTHTAVIQPAEATATVVTPEAPTATIAAVPTATTVIAATATTGVVQPTPDFKPTLVPTVARPTVTVRPTFTEAGPSSTPVPVVLTSTPVPAEPTSTRSAPSATPTSSHPSDTPVPADTATAALPTHTVVPPTSTEVPPTSTRVQPTSTAVRIHTLAQASPTATTAKPSPTARPTSTAAANTPVPVDTPQLPATATDTPMAEPTTMLAMASPTGTQSGSLVIPAVSSGGSATPTVDPSQIFPAVAAKNAPADSILANTLPFTPPVPLTMPAVPPPDAGELAVYRPLAHPTAPQDALAAFNLKVGVVKSSGPSHLVAVVTSDKRSYAADYQTKSFGYHLRLTIVSPVPASGLQPVSFDARASATLFLNKHQLTDPSTTPQCAGATPMPDGSIMVSCTENEPLPILGAYATFTFNTSGVLTSLDIQWVDTSSAPAIQAIPYAQAVTAVQSGDALIHASGAYPEAGTIKSVSVVYVPLNGAAGTYYEPVYQFSGVDTAGNAFEIYVPALDSRHYNAGS